MQLPYTVLLSQFTPRCVTPCVYHVTPSHRPVTGCPPHNSTNPTAHSRPSLTTWTDTPTRNHQRCCRCACLQTPSAGVEQTIQQQPVGQAAFLTALSGQVRSTARVTNCPDGTELSQVGACWHTIGHTAARGNQAALSQRSLISLAPSQHNACTHASSMRASSCTIGRFSYGLLQQAHV